MAAHTSRPGTKSNYDPSDDEDKKHKGKQHSAGEPKKTALRMQEDEEALVQAHKNVAEGKDNKRGNIGPSGQGQHRGRETRNRQAKASGRPDVAADTQRGHPGPGA